VTDDQRPVDSVSVDQPAEIDGVVRREIAGGRLVRSAMTAEIGHDQLIFSRELVDGVEAHLPSIDLLLERGA